MRFRVQRDQAAFREVVEAHATLVWGVCWQVLRHREDVEDAFQATFLILARKCSAIRAADSAAGWLYRVAFRTALAARARRRRLGAEPLAEEPPGTLEDQLASIERSEQCATLLEELHALGRRYREPLVLCYLEGRSRQQAADELGVTLASVKGRLARGLRVLRTRLAARGLALSSVAALAAQEIAAASAGTSLAAPIFQAATAGVSAAWASPGAAGLGVESSTRSGALVLAKKGILAMKFAAAAKPAMGLLAAGVTAGALAMAQAAPSSDGTDESAGGAAVIEMVSGGATIAAGAAAENTGEASDDAGDAETQSPGPTTIDSGWPGTLRLSEAPSGPQSQGTTTLAEVWPGVAGATLGSAGPQAVAVSGPPAGTFAGVAANGEAAVRTTAVFHGNPLAVQTTAAPRPAPNPRAGESTRQSVQLEMEHWELKASGLRKKADALKLKSQLQVAQADSESDRVVSLETDAEVDLTFAEVKLCEARAAALRGMLEPGDVLVPAPGREMLNIRFPEPNTFVPSTAAAPSAPAAPAAPATPSAPAALAPSPWNPPNPPLPREANPIDGSREEVLEAIRELRAQNEALRQRLQELEQSR